MTSETDDPEDKRGATRMRTLKGGKLVVANFSTFDCVIRNMSETGALVELPSTVGIPSHVTLRLQDGSPERQCRIAWRTERRIGLRFV
jgi:hypothetical protein